MIRRRCSVRLLSERGGRYRIGRVRLNPNSPTGYSDRDGNPLTRQEATDLLRTGLADGDMDVRFSLRVFNNNYRPRKIEL